MHSRKTLSIITSSAILLGTLSGCSLFDYLEKTNVTSSLLKYLTAVQEADYNESSELVVDGEDAFLLNEMSDTEAELIAAIQDASEYEIGEIDVNGSSATAQVIFTLPDIESIANEGYSYDEFIAAIADIEDTVDETIEFELVKEDDKWLIEGDSTEDYYEFLIEFISDLEFTRLTEENALETVDTFITLLSEGDITGANNLLTPNDNIFVSYIAMANLMPGLSDVLTAYSNRLTYTSEVTEITDDYIIVEVTGTAPDIQSAINTVLDNEEIMVPLYADYIEGTLDGQDENLLFFSMAGTLMTSVNGVLDTAQMSPVSFIFKVTENEDGELRLDLTGGPEINIDMDDLSSRTEYIIPAITQLLSDGRISFDQVLELQQMYGV